MPISTVAGYVKVTSRPFNWIDGLDKMFEEGSLKNFEMTDNIESARSGLIKRFH